jgi:hypothetical protein
MSSRKAGTNGQPEGSALNSKAGRPRVAGIPSNRENAAGRKRCDVGVAGPGRFRLRSGRGVTNLTCATRNGTESGVNPDPMSCGGSGLRQRRGRVYAFATLPRACTPARGGDTSTGEVDGDIGGLIAGAGAGGGWRSGFARSLRPRLRPGGPMAWIGESDAVVRSFGIVISAS